MKNTVLTNECRNLSKDSKLHLKNGLNHALYNGWNESKKCQSPVYANILETKNGVLITLATPGFEKSEITITHDKTLLKVTGKRENLVTKNHTRREFDYSNFERVFYLDPDFKMEEINAKIENGILSIELTKSDDIPAKQISIK